jgi:hypothetical protein
MTHQTQAAEQLYGGGHRDDPSIISGRVTREQDANRRRAIFTYYKTAGVARQSKVLAVPSAHRPDIPKPNSPLKMLRLIFDRGRRIYVSFYLSERKARRSSLTRMRETGSAILPGVS